VKIDWQGAAIKGTGHVLSGMMMASECLSFILCTDTLPPCAVKCVSLVRKLTSPSSSSSGWRLMAIVDEHLFVVMLMSVFNVTI